MSNSFDMDGDPITLNALNLPAFASFVDNGDGTGLLTVSAPADNVSSQAVSFTSGDGFGTTVIPQTIRVIAPYCGVAGNLVNLINAERARASQSALLIDTRLVQAAAQHSADMAATGVLSHVGSNGSTFQQRILAAGYDSPSGQLIANVSSSPQLAFDLWRNSGPHHATMSAFTHRHVGAAFNGIWWTVTFGASPNAPQEPSGCVQ